MNFKHTVHAAGKLQVRFRRRGNPTIGVKSNHCNRKWRLNFFQRGELFFGFSYHENKTCFEKSIARAFRWKGYTVGKVMGSCLGKYWNCGCPKCADTKVTSWMSKMEGSGGRGHFWTMSERKTLFLLMSSLRLPFFHRLRSNVRAFLEVPGCH